MRIHSGYHLLKKSFSHPFLVRFAQRYSECIFLFPVVLIPCVFTSFTTNTIVMKETILQFYVLLSILFFPLIWFSQPKKKTPAIQLGWPISIVIVLLLFLIYLAFSVHWISPHPRSEHEFLRWMSYILLVFISIPFAADPKRYQLYLLATVLTAFAISMYAIGQSFEFDPIYKDWDTFSFGVEGVRRVCGSLGNPDYLAGYLVALIPFTLFLSIAYAGIWRTASIFFLIVEIMAMTYTYSRGAEAALIAVSFLLLFSLFLLWFLNPYLFRPFLSWPRMIGIMAILVIFSAGLGWVMWDQISVTLQRLFQVGKDTSTVTRPLYWQGACAMWWSRPCTGMGLGSFSLHFPEFRPQQLTSYQPFNEFYVEHAHNEFFEIMAETGILGLLFYIFFFVLLTISIWRVLIKTRSLEHLTLLGLWSGIFAILIHNLFTVTLRFTPSAFILWSFSGVALGRVMFIESQTMNSVQASWKRYGIYLSMLACVPFLFVSAIRNYVGDYHIHQAKVWLTEIKATESNRYNHELLEKTFTALYKSLHFIPDHVENYYLLGLAYHKVYDYPQAVAAYSRLESMQKDFTSNRLNIAISYMKQADLVGGQSYLPKVTQPFDQLASDCLNEAIVWLKRGVENDPTTPDYHHYLGRTYFHLGNVSEAEKELTLALKLSENYAFNNQDSINPLPDIHAYLGRIYFFEKKWDQAKAEFQKTILAIQQQPEGNKEYQRELLAEINRLVSEIPKNPDTK